MPRVQQVKSNDRNVASIMCWPNFWQTTILYNIIGDGKHDLHKQLYEAVEPTTVGGVLGNVDIHDSEDFYIRYLHDFVRLVHRTEHSEAKNKTKEYEVK